MAAEDAVHPGVVLAGLGDVRQAAQLDLLVVAGPLLDKEGPAVVGQELGDRSLRGWASGEGCVGVGAFGVKLVGLLLFLGGWGGGGGAEGEAAVLAPIFRPQPVPPGRLRIGTLTRLRRRWRSVAPAG